MRFHDPGTEEALKRLARQVLEAEGRPAQKGRSASGGARSLFSQIVEHAILLAMITLGLGVWGSRTHFRSEGWQLLLSGCILNAYAFTLGGHLLALSFHPQTRQTLLGLPVPGRILVRWGQDDLLKAFARSLPVLAAVTWCLAGFPQEVSALPLLLAQTVVLAVFFMATCVVYTHPVAAWVRRKRIWLGVILYMVVLGATMFFTRKAPAPWALETAAWLSWLLPTTWVHPSRLLGLGGVLACGLVGWSLLHWRRLPDTLGPAWDQMDEPHDLASDDDDEDEYEDEDLDHFDDAAVEQAPSDGKTLLAAGLPAIEMPCAGWIEWLARALMPAQLRTLAALMMEPRPRWTTKWWWSLRALACVGAVMLALQLTGTTWPVLAGYATKPQGFLGGLGILFSLGCLPISNQIPRAMSLWNIGQGHMPWFASNPVSMRDLLRISTRLTVARSIPAVLLAGTGFTMLSLISKVPADPWLVWKVAPLMAVMWVFSRPLTLHFRLSSVCGFRKGAVLNRLLTEAVMVLCCLVWIFTFIAVPVALTTHEISFGYIILAMLANAISARLVFEIFHWRVCAGLIDFVKPIPQN